ncbi:MAG: hypothetical protein KAU14_09690 [Thermoplasmata archaeon]|nr:hypothetical protein [Thermoplasmata archaeon]
MSFDKKISKLFVIYLTIALVLASLLLISSEKVEAGYYKDKEVDRDQYDCYSIYASKEDKISIKFTVKKGSNADLYIISSGQFKRYKSNESFTASFSRENTSSVNEKWDYPDDQRYYIVVDNRDNVHSSDAEPTGDIVYDLEYDENWEELEEFLGYAIAIVAVCCVGIIIVIVVIIWLIVRQKKPSTVVVPTQPYYPPPQPYYPPPRGPPGYQPPPQGYRPLQQYQQPMPPTPGPDERDHGEQSRERPPQEPEY